MVTVIVMIIQVDCDAVAFLLGFSGSRLSDSANKASQLIKNVVKGDYMCKYIWYMYSIIHNMM